MANVIFLHNIKGVAQIGDVKKVADGYARNYLFPRNLAVLATAAELKKVGQLKAKRQAETEREAETSRAMATKLEGFVLNIERIASEEGTLYDGLDQTEISHFLKKNGFGVDPEFVLMEEHIKKIGEYEVDLDLGHEVNAKLKVNITKQAE